MCKLSGTLTLNRIGTEILLRFEFSKGNFSPNAGSAEA